MEGSWDTSKLNSPPLLISELVDIFKTTLGTHTSINAANIPSLESNGAGTTAQAIKGGGSLAIEKFLKEKSVEFGNTFGTQAYAYVSGKAMRPELNTDHLFEEFTSFCNLSLGVIDGLRKKTVADIKAFQKRATESKNENVRINQLILISK